MNLNELRDKAYQCAVAHGWHEEKWSDEHCLCLVISELMEAVEADRKGKHADVAKFKEWQGNSIPLTEETRSRRFKEDFETYIKGTVEEELADACIRILDLAGLRKIDLTDATNFVSELSLEKCKKDTKGRFTELIYEITKLLVSDEEEIDIKVNAVMICLITLCKSMEINLEWHINQKMKYNELRPYKHEDKNY